jgi:hypothetical protein
MANGCLMARGGWKTLGEVAKNLDSKRNLSQKEIVMMASIRIMEPLE